jgi:hypothetical protein
MQGQSKRPAHPSIPLINPPSSLAFLREDERWVQRQKATTYQGLADQWADSGGLLPAPWAEPYHLFGLAALPGGAGGRYPRVTADPAHADHHRANWPAGVAAGLGPRSGITGRRGAGLAGGVIAMPGLIPRPAALWLVVSGQRRPQPPSAHRTVRTGPYTAPHARLIH